MREIHVMLLGDYYLFCYIALGCQYLSLLVITIMSLLQPKAALENSKSTFSVFFCILHSWAFRLLKSAWQQDQGMEVCFETNEQQQQQQSFYSHYSGTKEKKN